jgi:hypothetical protein
VFRHFVLFVRLRHLFFFLLYSIILKLLKSNFVSSRNVLFLGRVPMKQHRGNVYLYPSSFVLWHIEALLGNDHETNNETSGIAKQQFCKYATVLEPLLGSDPITKMEVLLKAVFSMDPFRGSITRPLSSVSTVQCGEVSWLVSDLAESSALGSQLVHLANCSDSQRGLEAVNTEAEGSTTLEAITRQRLVKTQ